MLRLTALYISIIIEPSGFFRAHIPGNTSSQGWSRKSRPSPIKTFRELLTDNKGTEQDEDKKTGLSKWNSRINTFFDWKNEKEKNIMRKIGIYQYWKVVVIDEGPMLPGLPADWEPPCADAPQF